MEKVEPMTLFGYEKLQAEVKVRLPGGEKEFEIEEVKYQEIVFECH